MSSSEKSPAVLQGATPTPSALKHNSPTGEPVQQSFALSLSGPLPADTKTPSSTEVTAPPLRPLVRAGIKERLWLCIYLPVLPLEALVSLVPGSARAVVEDEQGIRRVLLANDKAAAAGIRVGLSVNAALSLLPDLSLEVRNPHFEERALKRLASWAEKFTSFVSIEAPSILLLEISGSLRLFGGMQVLRQRIVSGFEQQGFTVNLALAPTPLASIWLAKSGREICIDDHACLNSHLSTLPLHCLDWPTAITESLCGMGVTRVGDCLRLPREGFARRFGAESLLQLDRALGRLPDPRVNYRSAERFFASLDLEEEQSDSELLLHACRELLLKLERFLLIRQMQVQRIQFRFFHLRAEATDLALGSVQAGRNVGQWFELLSIKLERITLPEPVIAIRLRGGPGQLLSVATDSLLFNTSEKPRDASIARLVERLNARMGDACVRGVTVVAEHRPQYAWRSAGLSEDTPHCAAMPGFWNEHQAPALLQEIRRARSLLLRRPLWMLENVKLLANEQGQPFYQGRLTLVDGPERLESGWWDDAGIARDYYVALTVKGVYLWIYQDRAKNAAWYLHGFFG
jgi:protein ImuB